jgi:hypothetical protein
VVSGDRLDAFFRLLGDVDGDGDVDRHDWYAFYERIGAALIPRV